MRSTVTHGGGRSPLSFDNTSGGHRTDGNEENEAVPGFLCSLRFLLWDSGVASWMASHRPWSELSDETLHLVKLSNQRVATNRRPASPSAAEREFESSPCAPLSLSAAVAHSDRSPTTV